MYSDGLLKLPLFTIQKNFKILLTVYSLSPHMVCSQTGSAVWKITDALRIAYINYIMSGNKLV